MEGWEPPSFERDGVQPAMVIHTKVRCVFLPFCHILYRREQLYIKVCSLIDAWSLSMDLLGLQILYTHDLHMYQARSQGGFEGVWTNPPCSLAKFIFNETAAVQGTIIQPCSGIVTDGIQAIMQSSATRVSHIHVACRSVCDWDQEFWSVKIILDCLITPFRGSWSLDYAMKVL